MYAFPSVAVWHDVTLSTLKEKIIPLGQPAILKNALSSWPIVEAAQSGEQTFLRYLSKHSHNAIVSLMENSGHDGRMFYNEEFSGVNFTVETMPFGQALDTLCTAARENSKVFYIGNTPVRKLFPSMLQENHNDFLVQDAHPGIWLSNRVKIAAHFDVPDNIACCIYGKRRFTLFPPNQIDNLYIGPVDATPAGQPISLVDMANPDFTKFPKFKEALKHALVAELMPGDALYLPSLWWHQVESLSDLNVLMTYFHDATPRHLGSAYDCLLHGLMSLRQLPEHKKKAWQAFFNHYVFSDNKQANAHIPKNLHGVLGDFTPTMAKNIKHMVTQKLNQ